MNLAILGVALISVLGVLGLFLYINRIVKSVNSLFVRENDETPSEAERFVFDTTGAIVPQLIDKVKASLMGERGVVAKAEKALMRDAMETNLQETNPVLGVIFDQLPKKWQNKITANPSYAIAAYNLLKSGGILGGAPNNGQNGGSTPVEIGSGKW